MGAAARDARGWAMNGIAVWLGVGLAMGTLSMLWLTFVPQRYHRVGPWLAVLAGGILAQVEFSQIPDWPGHSFEREPQYFFFPTMVAMAGVFGVVTLVARRWKWIWLGALVGAALYPILRSATFLVMLYLCCY